MGAFSPIWKDIDDTSPGTPYIVDSDGWGWFFVFILLSIPFLAVGSALVWTRNIVCAYPVLSAAIYIVLCGLFGIVFYGRRSFRHRVFGIIGSMLTLFPLGTAVGFYIIPYFIFSICNLVKNGLIHFVLGIVFFAIVLFMVVGNLSSSTDVNWEVIKQIYKF